MDTFGLNQSTNDSLTADLVENEPKYPKQNQEEIIKKDDVQLNTTKKETDNLIQITNPKETTSSSKQVDTSDTTNYTMYIILGFVAMIGIIGCVKDKKGGCYEIK